MGMAQIIVLALMLMDLSMALAKHGEPYPRPISFWRMFCSSAVILGLLYWGGFFAR